jgi:hypothetical protein
MANRIYPLYRQNLLAGTAGYDLDVNTAVDGPFCALIDTGAYVYNDGHAFFSSVSGIIGTPQQITNPTVALGVFDGDNLTYLTVPAGPDIEALIVYRHNSGANTTWPLVMYYDQPGGGLPVVPNGGNINVTWNSGGIFSLGAA